MWPATGREGSVSYLIEGECTPRPGPRFSWHRLVATEGANEMVALESGGAPIEFAGQCPCSGVQGTDTQRVTDGFVRCQVVGFTRPAQSLSLIHI